MIYSVALNPAIDRTLEIPNFQAGQTFKSNSSVVFYAGKGINVAVTLKELGHDPGIIAFIGENQLYSYSNALNQFRKTFLPVKGDTRNNITIIDPVQHTETHIREPGFEISIENIRQIQDVIKQSVNAKDWVIFTGSLPPGAPLDLYATLIRAVSGKGAFSVFDSSGEALIQGVRALPYVLKINTDELAGLTGKAVDSISEIVSESSQFIAKGCRFVIITLGKTGAVGMSPEGKWLVEIPRDFKGGINTVGCGDGFLGGLTAKLVNGLPFKSALVHAAACGAANTLRAGAGRIRMKDVAAIESVIKIKSL